MDQWLDASRPPREGETLDVDKLEPYLNENLPEAGGKLEVEQFPSGFSNLTYLLRLGDLELVLRRPPFGNRVKSAHDMGREYRVLDKMPSRWRRKIDIYMGEDVAAARAWGVRRVRIRWLSDPTPQPSWEQKP